MQSTISLFISISFFFFFIPRVSIQFLSPFRGKMPIKKKKIVVGKVIVAKAIGIFILYIGRIRFVINQLGKRKRITKTKEIN